jgi:histidine ammonia-lyase
MTPALVFGDDAIGIEHVRAALAGPCQTALSDGARQGIARSAATIDAILADGRTVYGVNTGFGLLAKKTIAPDQLAELQRNLILSHCCGVGAPLPDDVVRLILLLKIAGLARGFSGVRLQLIEMLIRLLALDILPVIPEKGSVGASGDLAPLAHLASTLLGVGELKVAGKVVPAAEGLKAAGLEPIVLRAKEGLALINGTQVSTALALKGLVLGQNIFQALWWPARSVSTPWPAAMCRSTRASTPPVASRARSRSRAACAPCSTAARSAPAMRTATACRIPTACGASRRSWAPCSICWRTPSAPC